MAVGRVPTGGLEILSEVLYGEFGRIRPSSNETRTFWRILRRRHLSPSMKETIGRSGMAVCQVYRSIQQLSFFGGISPLRLSSVRKNDSWKLYLHCLRTVPASGIPNFSNDST